MKPSEDLPTPVFRLRGTRRDREMVIDLPVGAFYVGSSRKADVRLPVDGVSRRHALLTVTSSSLVVEDLDSTNGTWVDGTRIERQTVSIGSELRLGPTRFRLETATAEEIELAIDLDPAFEPRTPLSALALDDSTLVVRSDQATGQRPSRRPVELSFPATYCAGTSASMVDLYAQMARLLRGVLPVLVTGETGVGKEWIARILHDSSDRRQGPFVAINCAALPSELLEAEMFGIGRGVATGVEPRRGQFELADGGTILLDEIGEMPLAAQAKLLRALQEKEIQPLGESPRQIDVRVIAATHVELSDRDGGNLRPDLFYRLAGGLLEIPPLRHRSPDDLLCLIEHFLRRFREESEIRVRGISVAALRTLQAYHWPGNVRELEHEMRRLVYGSRDAEVIRSDRLADRLHRPRRETDPMVQWLASRGSLELAPALRAVEEALLREALRRANGKKIEACRLLALSRNGLDKKLKRLGITVETRRRRAPGHSTDS